MVRKTMCIGVLLLLLVPGLVYAQSSNIAVGVKALLFSPSESEMEESVAISLFYTSKINAEWGVMGTLDISNSDIEDSDDVTITIWAGTINGIYYLADDLSKVIPYVGAGIGIYNAWIDNSIDDDTDMAFGFQALGGVSYMISEKFSVDGEARYVVAESSDYDVDLGGLFLGGGVSWYF